MTSLDKQIVEAFEAELDKKIKKVSTADGKETTHLAEVLRVDNDGTIWVHIYGGANETPVRNSAVTVDRGDLVHVVISNGSVTISSNMTYPVTSQSYVDNMAGSVTAQIGQQMTQMANGVYDKITAQEATIGTLTAGIATINVVVAGKADIDDLEANYAHLTNGVIDNATIGYADINDLNANYAHLTNGVIDNAQIGYADVKDLDANYAHLTNGVIDNAKIGYADVNGLSANYAHLTNGVIDNAQIGYADVKDLSANYAHINLANVNTAQITNGVIQTAAIVDEQVFTVTGNKATISEINADKITVRNLHTSNLTVDTADGYVTIGTKQTPTKEYIDSLKDEIQDKIDATVETFTSSAVPLLNNYPASQWATDDERLKHVGDICFVTNSAAAEDGYCYRFAYDATTQSFMWVLIKDNDVTKALRDITDLQEFESDTTTWIEETDEGLTTIRANHTALAGVVDKTLVESVQLWYSKADTTAPSKPTAAVTSTSTAGNAWRVVVPAYNASYPNYYYCYQWKYADGTYGWSSVTRDIAMGEAQAQARTAASNLASYITSNDAAVQSLQGQIDGAVDIWYGTADPTASTKPWDSGDADSVHEGDLYYNTATGHAFRFAVSGSSYAWVQMPDSDAAAALLAAQDAQATADGKRRIFTAQPTVPYDVGDLWVNGSEVKYATVKKATGQAYTASDWSLTATDDTAANAAQATADKNVRSSIQLWFTKADETAPAKPTAEVTSTSTAGNGWRTVVPVYDAAYPSYFYCWQYELADGTFAWSDVVLDRATGETQAKSSAALPAATFTTFQSTTFKELVDEVGEQSSTITTMSERIDEKADSSTVTTLTNTVNSVKQTADANTASITNLTKTVSDNKTEIETRASTIEQNLSGITTRVSATETELEAMDERVTAAETSIEQNADAITLKANAADVYTKTEADGLISTEVSNRNAAIEASADAITLSVSETYATKTETFGDLDGYTPVEYIQGGTNARVNTGITVTRWPIKMRTVVEFASGFTASQAEQDFWGNCVANAPGRFVFGTKSGYWYLYSGKNTLTTRAVSAGVRYDVTVEYFGGSANLTVNGETTKHTNTGNPTPSDSTTYTVGLLSGRGDAQYLHHPYAKVYEAQYYDAGVLRFDAVPVKRDSDGALGFYDFVTNAFFPNVGTGSFTAGPDKTWMEVNSKRSSTSYSYSEAELKVANDEISARVEKDGVISAINLSSESATISADKVNIEGAAIFTSGRLSQSSLDSAYDANGAAASAQETAISAAAADATSKANAAEESAKSAIVSMGEQLILNGNGFLGDNTNFSALTFDGFKANGSRGSFTKAVAVKYATVRSDESFPVDVNSVYDVSVDLYSDGSGTTPYMYGMLIWYDSDGNEILYQNWHWRSGSTTTLSQDLESGDTVVHLTSAAGLATGQSSIRNTFIIWDYENSGGYRYPEEVYSRHFSPTFSVIDKTANTVTLSSAYSGATVPAGTYVSQGMSGNTYEYFAYGYTVEGQWTRWLGKYGPGTSHPFCAATATCKIGFLWNYNTTVSPSAGQSKVWVTNLSCSVAKVSRTQRIYYRQTASGSAPGVNTTWLSTSGTGYGNWSLKIPQLTSGTTKYPKLYTAVQTQTVAQQAAGDTCSCSPVQLDDSTTVIDGGNIITGSVSANSVDATSGTFSTANIPDLSAAKITSGYLSADRIEAGSIEADKLSVSDLQAIGATIGGFDIDTTSIHTKDVAVTSNADNSVGLSSSTFTRTVNGTSRGDLKLAIGSKFGVDKAGNLYASGAYLTGIQIGNTDLVIGGTNLLRFTTSPTYIGTWPNTADPKASTGWYRYGSRMSAARTDDGIKYTHDSSTTLDGIVIPLTDYDAAVGGEEYTLSFKYRTNLTTTGAIYLLVNPNLGTSGNILVAASSLTASSDEWQTFKRTITWPSTSGKVVSAFLIGYVKVASSWLEIKDGSMKLERGNVATAWSPAPEDVEYSVSSAAASASAPRFHIDEEYSQDGATVTVTAHVMSGLSEVTSSYPASCFAWYLKSESGASPLVPLDPATGYSTTLSRSDVGYGAAVVCRFTEPSDAALLTGDDDTLTDSEGTALAARVPSGDYVRVADLEATTTVFDTDSLMLVGSEEERLVSIATLKDVFGDGDYGRLSNKPSIEGVTLLGDKSFDQLGIFMVDDQGYDVPDDYTLSTLDINALWANAQPVGA